ncbi:MAG: VIT1/CCC1 transporter family protein [Thermoplasmata archaeon]|jgi:predicted membrane protein (TIGR00267 family)
MVEEEYRWTREDLRQLDENLVDERSTQWLYETLAKREGDSPRGAQLKELADFEERHATIWENLIVHLRRRVPRKVRLWEHRLLIWLARVFGVGTVLPILHRIEVDGIRRYRDQASRWKDPAAKEAFDEILADEVSHEIDLFETMRESGRSGGTLRSAVLGANDGLGSILALVVGVAAAGISAPVVVIAGVAGLIAGAVSMAASGYISVKAEQDVYASQVSLQRAAYDVAPEARKGQLAEAYEAKGLSQAEAELVVERLAENEDEFLRALLAEARGIGQASFENPTRLALYTGLAFVSAGLIPILPFLALPVSDAIIGAVVVAAAALFLAGVLRSLSTLNSFLKSGVEMVLIGLGAAVATYLVGLAVGGIVGL